MELGLPMVVLDYAQIEDAVDGADSARKVGQAEPTQTAEKPEEMPARPKLRKRRLLIGRDKWTKQVMAHLVRCKGLGDETIVKRVTQSVDELGYRTVVIKTDGEPALISV